MDSKKFIDDTVEKIMTITGTYEQTDEVSGVVANEQYRDVIREKLTGIMCEVIHMASRDSNLAQECNYIRLTKEHG